MDSAVWRLARRPGLDGLRGIAILMVLCGHTALFLLVRSEGELGSAGVEVFFTLSGFLITALLLEEHATSDRISLSSFYVRRARRLFPALSVLLLGVLFMARAAGVSALHLMLPTVFYYANWVAEHGHSLGPLNATWSLSVEEQFYLVWPLALMVVLRWRHGATILAAAVVVGSTVNRFLVGTAHAYYGTDSQAGALALGALLACVAHSGWLRDRRMSPWIPAACLLPMVTTICWDPAWVIPLLTLIPALTVVVIWGCCCNPGGLLAARWLRYVGHRSYALYLFHLPLFGFVAASGASQSAAIPLAWGLTFLAAELSWRYVERPFLRRPPPAEESHESTVSAAEIEA